MGTKINPGAFDCEGKALPDEPKFTLLARDPHAPQLVRDWAQRREGTIDARERPASDMAIVIEARKCADDMERWRITNDGKWRTDK